jgi:hypothetical protein
MNILENKLNELVITKDNVDSILDDFDKKIICFDIILNMNKVFVERIINSINNCKTKSNIELTQEQQIKYDTLILKLTNKL